MHEPAVASLRRSLCSATSSALGVTASVRPQAAASNVDRLTV